MPPLPRGGRRESQHPGRGAQGRFPVLEGRPQPPAARTHLHEVVDGLQVGQVVVIDVHTDAEVEARIAAVDDLKVPELRAERLSATGRAQDPTCRAGGMLGPIYLVLHSSHGP